MKQVSEFWLHGKPQVVDYDSERARELCRTVSLFPISVMIAEKAPDLPYLRVGTTRYRGEETMRQKLREMEQEMEEKRAQNTA